MRILVLNHNLVERGAYFRARETARLFRSRGHDVTFACTGLQYYRAMEARRPRWRSIRTANWTPIKDPGEGLSPFGLVQRMALAAQRHDLVYTFCHKPVDQFPARLARRLGAFWVADWCDLWRSTEGGILDMRQWPSIPPGAMGWRGPIFRGINRWEDSLERAMIRDADAVTIISRWMRRETRRLRRRDEDVHLYTSGADTARVRPMDKAAARAALRLSPAGPVIGYVANVTPDNEQLDGAMRRVWAAMPEATLLVAGPELTGEAIAEGSRAGRAVQLGRIPFAEVPTVLGAADILTIPMRDTRFNWSRWPHKFGDYIAAGRPIATTRIGDTPETIERHRIGAVGAPTADGLAEALLALLRNPGEWDAMGRRARAAAEGPESWTAHFGGLCRWLNGKGLAV